MIVLLELGLRFAGLQLKGLVVQLVSVHAVSVDFQTGVQ